MLLCKKDQSKTNIYQKTKSVDISGDKLRHINRQNQKQRDSLHIKPTKYVCFVFYVIKRIAPINRQHIREYT